MYKSVSLEVTGNSPGSKITVTGEFINYSLTILKNAPHSRDAIDFVSFLLSRRGMEIFRENGQKPLTPFIYEQSDKVPDELKRFFETKE